MKKHPVLRDSLNNIVPDGSRIRFTDEAFSNLRPFKDGSSRHQEGFAIYREMYVDMLCIDENGNPVWNGVFWEYDDGTMDDIVVVSAANNEP